MKQTESIYFWSGYSVYVMHFYLKNHNICHAMEINMFLLPFANRKQETDLDLNGIYCLNRYETYYIKDVQSQPDRLMSKLFFCYNKFSHKLLYKNTCFL